MFSEIEIDELKAAEKDGKIDKPAASNGKRKNRPHKRKRDRSTKACTWHYNQASGWGLSLLTVGGLGLMGMAGYAVNWWALLLLLPGLFAITSGVALVRWQPAEAWVFWPLFGGLMMTVGGFSLALGLSWQTSLAVILMGSGALLLWLATVRHVREP